MKIKVCGLTDPDNVAEIVAEGVDYVGFNFWPGTPRCVSEGVLPALVQAAGGVKRVGVFVNEDVSRITRFAPLLDLVQLHGDETVEFCREVANATGLPVVKAFGVAAAIPPTDAYAACAGFLFDTATSGYGGSGEPFDWRLIEAKPAQFVWLAGGIGPDNAAEAARAASRIGAEAIDINSRVEVRPGWKSQALVRSVVQMVKYEI